MIFVKKFTTVFWAKFYTKLCVNCNSSKFGTKLYVKIYKLCG